MHHPVILASGSEVRRQLLSQAGVPFGTEITDIDEQLVKKTLQAEGTTFDDIADTLAESKARFVAEKFRNSLIIGCDQILVFEDRLIDKAKSIDEARKTLLELRGKTHKLLTAVVVFEQGVPVWRHIGRAKLIMRDFSNSFLDNYLNVSGAGILDSVGCYKLEQDGVQLFSEVQGDYFTVLGFPLIEILGFLRTRGVVAT
jgi:nucleoside triphosphate pyrophosphatase